MLVEIWTFIRRHWPHALLAIPGALLVTLLHEAAHALAAWAQGGTLLEFAWLPWASEGHWGYVRYDFPVGMAYSEFAIAVAPYVLWLALATVAWLLSWLPHGRLGYGVASTVFFWLYFVPLADIANTAVPWLRGRENDFSNAFGPPESWSWSFVSLLALFFIVTGYRIQSRLYASGRLGKGGYAVLVLLTSAVLLTML